ncbi:MAG: DoxX family membrane protein [Flavobacteriaceae bacterium]|nr:DoxX family membrane protein [Flavobacteriaceae bacterium]
MMKLLPFFTSSKAYHDLSLLFARLFTGYFMLTLHGWGKITAGTDRWNRLGSSLSDLIGLDFLSIPLGFMASFAESIGAILIIIGLTTRPAAFLLAFTMFVAVCKKLPGGIKGAELPALFLCLSLVILLSGAGKYSIDYLLKQKK